MRINSIVLATLALAACNKDKGDTGGDPVETCTIEAAAEYPIDQQTDAYYRSPVEFSLSEADSSATVSLADASGAAVSGDVSFNEDGDTVYFTPSTPLASSSNYTATLTWCDGEKTASTSFTTSALGAELTTDITGKTYVVDLAAGRFLEPAGVGDLIGGLLENAILIGVVSAGAELEIRGALSVAGGTTQDTCAQTLEDFPNADFSETPYFEIPEGDVTLSVAGYDIVINSMSLSGTFAADGSYFGGGVLKGELDARDIGPLLEDQLEDTSPEYVCELLIGFGVSCIPCSSDDQPYCATIHVDQLTAEEEPGTLIEIAATDCHETCADSCANKECAEAETFPVCM